MHVDLLTLYSLAIGTLFASAGMTFWERRTLPKRSKALTILAAGYATLALGCATVTIRSHFPGISGSALSNLVILAGYLLILQGAAAVSGRRYRVSASLLLLVMGAIWVFAGPRWPEIVWLYVCAIPIALTCAMTARELLRRDAMPTVQSRHIAVAMTSIHAFVYLFRAIGLPLLVVRYGNTMQAIASKVTMYEGVMYSVVMPMTLLRLFRDEAHGELLRASQTDYLTRLGNRRWFFEEGPRVLRDLGADVPASLLAFDLDHFKAINDRYGHKMGDEVLKSFAEIACGVLGPDAILARIGGEEFAALLPDHDLARAKAKGEGVARRFAETRAHRAGNTAIEATVSIGLARFDSTVHTLADLLAIADRALYRAKSLGGNRLEMESRRLEQRAEVVT